MALSATEDGNAIATVDKSGGIRLWPVADGTREPVVIIGTAPRALALARDGAGFTLATLDPAGGVHVIRTTATGAVRERITLAGDQPVTELDATPDGFLALRADQTLDFVGLAGKVIAHLASEPGMHIESIVTRGRRALALVLEDKQLHGRWIDLDHGVDRVQWGAATPKLEGKIAHGVLSPGGDLLAVTRPRSLHPALIDLAKGTQRKVPLCVNQGWPRADGFEMDDAELLREGTAPVPLGFLTDGVVACSVMSSLIWWSTAGEAVQSQASGLMVGTTPFAVTDRAVIVALGGNLAFGGVAELKFLGYGIHSVEHLHTGPGGLMITAEQEALEVDPALQSRARFESARGRIDWLDAIPLDERYAITLTSRRVYRTDGVQVAVFDGLASIQHQTLPYDVRDNELSYEPATRLLATSDGGVAMLVQLDPVSHTFGEPTRIGGGTLLSKLRVVDPALAGGVAALKFDDAGGGLTVGEILAKDIAPGGEAIAHTTYHVPGELVAVDRTGRVYTRAAAEGDIIAYRHGVAGARLRDMAAFSVLRPNADGSLLVAFDSPRVVLVASDGTVKWDTQHWNSMDVRWTPGGELAAQFSSGLATIDLATGGLAQRHCGWGFGLSDQPFDATVSNASICDIAR